MHTATLSTRSTLMYVNAAHFFDHLFLLIFPTAAIAIARGWDISYGEALIMGTPMYVMFALGTLPAGWLGDKYDRVFLTAVFFIGCGLSSLAISASTGPASMMVGLGCLGLFTSLYHPVALALISDISKRSGRALAINGVFGNLGLAGAAVLTGFLSQYGGWQLAFIVPGAISLLTGCTLINRRVGLLMSNTALTTPDRTTPTTERRHIQLTVFAVICVTALFSGIVFNGITVSLPKFFDERLTTIGGNLAEIGAYTGLVFGIASFAQLPVGELLDRLGARAILLPLLTTQIVLILLLVNAHGWTVLLLSLALTTLIFAQIPINSWLLGRYVKSGLRSRALSVEYLLSLGVGSAVVPCLATMHQKGWGFSVQFVGLAIFAACVLVAAVFLPARKPVSISAVA